MRTFVLGIYASMYFWVLSMRTGFSNSITSPAMDFKNEGIIFGLCVKMFSISGPVIVIGVLASALVGLIYLFI